VAAGRTIESISAVTLLTSDMARSVSFYQAMGFETLYGSRDASFTSHRAGAGFLNLEYAPASHDTKTLWGRIVFRVDDVDAMHRRAVAAGLIPQSEPADAAWGERFFHIRDPDGHELSFARPLSGPG